MPEFLLTNDSNIGSYDGSHAGCSLCGSIEGPFVAVTNATFRVNTANGPVISDTPLQLCAPKYDPTDSNIVLRQGCAGAIAATARFVPPETLRGAQQSIADAHARIAEVEAERDDAIRKQTNLISVDDLQKLIADANRAVQ